MYGLLINKLNPDIIVHLAAIHFIPQCEKNPFLAYETNVLSTIFYMFNVFINFERVCPKLKYSWPLARVDGRV